tara:strand:+ start:190 stop:465 length:276 start_codon:yes stop_codon:yes gene_type:complete
MIEDDTHDQLVKAYLEYFKSNEDFARRPSEVRRREVRKHLSLINKLSKIRRQEIIDYHRQHITKDGRQHNLTPKAIAARQKREQEANKSDT